MLQPFGKLDNESLSAFWSHLVMEQIPITIMYGAIILEALTIGDAMQGVGTLF